MAGIRREHPRIYIGIDHFSRDQFQMVWVRIVPPGIGGIGNGEIYYKVMEGRGKHFNIGIDHSGHSILRGSGD